MKGAVLRVPDRQTTPGWGREGKPLTLDVERGKLSIYYETGPLVMAIRGRKTLHRLALMLLAHAR